MMASEKKNQMGVACKGVGREGRGKSKIIRHILTHIRQTKKINESIRLKEKYTLWESPGFKSFRGIALMGLFFIKVEL